ncbi:CFEM domain-containing protein [Mycena sanguinolenta]|uniref:CFEM domain-containing protein n=1 Tax=Mycena sanguinolenta TaxID=230812 RepID=A0A8H6Z4W2_9AGAR|nr:CFEM domain-containing protein [Mycena sanguinolenta]
MVTAFCAYKRNKSTTNSPSSSPRVTTLTVFALPSLSLLQTLTVFTMRFSAALTIFSLFAASVSASYTPLYGLSRRQGPACEQSCLAHPDLGSCGASDLTCLCNSSAFVQGTFDCIQAACSGTDLEEAIELAAATCQSVGVVLSSAAGAEFSATASLGSSTASAGAATGTSPAPAASNTAQTSTTPSSSTTPNGARSSSANTALFGLAAIGVIAFAL